MEKKDSLPRCKSRLPCDFPAELREGEWLVTQVCFDYQKDTCLAKSEKPSAPHRIRYSLTVYREFSPFAGRTDLLVTVPQPTRSFRESSESASLFISLHHWETFCNAGYSVQ